MEAKLEILSQFFKELGIEPLVETIDQRLMLQKSVFLGECFGVDLGYSYNWYVKGPYSPSLTEDYYELQNYSVDDVQLAFKHQITESLQRMKGLLDRKNGEDRVKWFEALASIAFLIKKSNKSESEALEVMATAKQHIDSEMRTEALDALKECNIV